MARTVNYVRKIEKIKEQLDELSVEMVNCSKREPVVVEQKIKVSEIDFENEELSTLIKIQSRLMRVIQSKIKK